MNNSTAMNLYEAIDFCSNLHEDSMIVEIYDAFDASCLDGSEFIDIFPMCQLAQ